MNNFAKKRGNDSRRRQESLEVVCLVHSHRKVTTIAYFARRVPKIAMILSKIHSTVVISRHCCSRSFATAKEMNEILNENKVDKKWAASPDARVVMAAGSKTPFPSSGLSETSMEAFMLKRGWKDATYDLNPSAHRTLTAALTFPLTLAHGINKIFHGNSPIAHGMQPRGLGAETIANCVEGNLSHPPNPDREKGRKIWNKQARKLRVLVVGARAEASLPALWWREGLINTSSHVAQAGLSIGMVGPSIPDRRPITKEPNDNDAATVNVTPSSSSRTRATATTMPGHASPCAYKHCEVTIPTSHTSLGTKTTIVYHTHNSQQLLHEHEDCMKLLLNTDIFVLFHPGLGHEHLKSHWKPTIELLLSSKKPLLCTAHSLTDLRRDVDMIHSVAAEIDGDGEQLGNPIQILIEGCLNPFASTRRTYDPKEENGAQIVTTNQYIHAFCSK